jgi:aerobic-type carbon monoxide dehydrogenase small subunit (CoxS/CutS family)
VPAGSQPPPLDLVVDGVAVTVPDEGWTLLDVLRGRLGATSVKDGCSPQGQCGCCTVLVDGAPRVACVTPVRRVAGRAITTFDGLPAAETGRWVEAFCAAGASQCGFCTPGIVVRLAALRAAGAGPDDDVAVGKALLAHLCRCTGWRTIFDAWRDVGLASPPRDLAAAAHRAGIEGRTPQRAGADVAAGRGGFAADTAPAGALVAVPAGEEYAVAESVAEARRLAGKVQGRRTTATLTHPIELPAGSWDLTLRTTWVEPAYLETDAAWCAPGGEPAGPLANGGAFGGKVHSPVAADARRLADEHGRPVRVLWSREDSVRRGPKRPPVAAGARAGGEGVVRVARTPGVAAAIAAVAPRFAVEEVDVAGPRTTTDARAAGWAEAAILLAALRAEMPVRIESPDGAYATADFDGAGIRVRVGCGDPLDDVVLRSYCIGAAHMAYGWVTSEGIAVDAAGEPLDLTIRSFGIVRAVDTPAIDVEIDRTTGPPVNGSDAVFVAVAAAVWIAQGCPQDWPTTRS